MIGKLAPRLEALKKEYFAAQQQAALCRERETRAACQIQRMWRGKYVRKGVFSLKYTVRILEKALRAFLEKRRVGQIKKSIELKMRKGKKISKN
jgi:hypothetical protein